MEANHEKRMRKAVKWARDKIFNNGSASGTNCAVLDLSMPSPTSESFDKKKTVMLGIECKDKKRYEENMRRAMI